jgi:hypothetical protein
MNNEITRLLQKTTERYRSEAILKHFAATLSVSLSQNAGYSLMYFVFIKDAFK